MPRLSRAIAVGYPHHIMQWGNYRQTVFSEAADYNCYLELMSHFAPKHGLEIWAYCLMPNHVHFIGVPSRQESMARTFSTVHMLYAQQFNRRKKIRGHLWQGRFFSCALDERHLRAAIRHIELNPVMAGLATAPQDHPWSSARSRLNGADDPLLSYCFMAESMVDWGQYLGEDQDRDAAENVIKATRAGRPCGGEDFVSRIERLLNRRFAARPRGRPRKKPNADIDKIDNHAVDVQLLSPEIKKDNL